MNYYNFHIGDYAAHTRHLSPMEDLVYRRLLDVYYLSEKALPESIEQCCRIIGLNDRSTDVQQVLNEFFVLGETGWESDRANAEIAAFHAKKKQASEAGKASAAARKPLKDKECKRTFNDRSTDVQPTNNQEPLKNKDKKQKELTPATAKAVAVLVPKSNDLALLTAIDGMTEQVAKDFLTVRKAKKSPLTATAIALIAREAGKAGITTSQAIAIATARNWVSFKAEWVADKDGKTHAERTQDYKDQQAEKFYAPLLTMTDEEKREWGFA